MQDNFQGLLHCNSSSHRKRMSRYAILLCCVFRLLAQKVSRVCNTGVPALKLYQTEIIHFRNMSENESQFEFKIGNNIIQKVNKYK